MNYRKLFILISFHLILIFVLLNRYLHQFHLFYCWALVNVQQNQWAFCHLWTRLDRNWKRKTKVQQKSSGTCWRPLSFCTKYSYRLTNYRIINYRWLDLWIQQDYMQGIIMIPLHHLIYHLIQYLILKLFCIWIR